MYLVVRLLTRVKSFALLPVDNRCLTPQRKRGNRNQRVLYCMAMIRGYLFGYFQHFHVAAGAQANGGHLFTAICVRHHLFFSTS